MSEKKEERHEKRDFNCSVNSTIWCKYICLFQQLKKEEQRLYKSEWNHSSKGLLNSLKHEFWGS